MKQWVHMYNLEGRHFFTTVRTGTIAEALAQPAVIESSMTADFPIRRGPVGVATCFSFGPMAGIAITIPDEPKPPRVPPHEAALIWMATKDGLESGFIETRALARTNREA